MDKRIEEVFGKSKIYSVEESLLIEQAQCVSIFKCKNKPILIVRGKIFCGSPSEIIQINDINLLGKFSDAHDVLRYIKNGTPDARLEEQKKLVHMLRVYNKLNKKSVNEMYRRESLELI